MPQTKIPAFFMRGGTSKGVLFNADDLPADPTARDEILLTVLGSPDLYRRQIDGLGGASSSTSKAAIISKSSKPDCDVEYLIGQVDIETAIVDYSANCGNLSAAVGPYAINTGLVKAEGPVTEVHIWQVNTSRKIIARVPTANGLPVERGDYVIDGVMGSGARIDLEFFDPVGSFTGKLLPTGNLVDLLDIPGLPPLRATILDAGLAVVFVNAVDIGLTGSELKPAIDNNSQILETLEEIRNNAAVLMGLAADPSEARRGSPTLPKVAFVARPADYASAGGREVSHKEIDLRARIISMGVLHHAYEVTGAIATSVAAALPGTVVNEIATPHDTDEKVVRIGHTSGTISVGVKLTRSSGCWSVQSTTIGRTARTIMEGLVCLPSSID